jgi:DNA polymerase-1
MSGMRVRAPLGADLVAVAFGPHHGAVSWSDGTRAGTVDEVVAHVAELESSRRPRWVWWAADPHAAAIVSAGLTLSRCWDLAEAHRILVGGWGADPGHVWANALGLDPSGTPEPAGGDLFDFFTPTGPAPTNATTAADATRPDGHLRPEVLSPDFLLTPEGPVTLADLALRAAVGQRKLLAQRHTRAVTTAYSESAAALLCLELSRDGLPVHRPTLESLIAAAAGPRPESERHAAEIRRERDRQVLRHVPGRESTDLRNPVQVRELLGAVGVVVPDTRAWRLEPFRATHPVVEALLQWRKAERIATTYGYAWLAAHVGPDDRLRGGWTACDGAAGRMTAQNGLHNLPAPLRPAVAAHRGHVFVRADLGQIEPRVLAAVSGDRGFAAAARSDDLYAPVAADLGVERPVAKVAVLAAMYGQTSGPAGEALRGMERSYPVALAYLRSAADAGAAGRAVQTHGGRRVPVPSSETPAARAAHGRFARNAVVQGAAAELFKAWAATVRLAVAPLGAQIVLCLHDELLLHVPREHSGQVAALVSSCLDDAARRWTGSREVRFVADTSIIERWSDAKA